MDSTDKKPDSGSDEQSTRQRIIDCAADLFASKGFTETTIRELADAVGLNAASLYYHFPSKNAILDAMLDDYMEQVWGNTYDPLALLNLKENPTAEGIVGYMQLAFPEERADYYLKVLNVLLQEQHRNPSIRRYVAENFINNESFVRNAFDVLKEQGAIRADADPIFWMNVASSLLYAYSNRMMLGIGDSNPGFDGMPLVDALLKLYNLMLKDCAPDTEV